MIDKRQQQEQYLEELYEYYKSKGQLEDLEDCDYERAKKVISLAAWKRLKENKQ